MKSSKKSSPLQKTTSTFESLSGAQGKIVQASISGPRIRPNFSAILQTMRDTTPHSPKVQLSTQGKGTAEDNVKSVATSGVQGSGGSLPYAKEIQHSFGRHDVSHVQAHVGGAAKSASEELGATAYATGNQIAFKEAPNLHLAAHEAAHTVQQRAGVQLAAGIGSRGDRYEQNADAVADRVVAGKSSEDLLGSVGTGAGSSTGVQAQSVQFADFSIGDVAWDIEIGPLGDGTEGVIATPLMSGETLTLTEEQVTSALGMPAGALVATSVPNQFQPTGEPALEDARIAIQEASGVNQCVPPEVNECTDPEGSEGGYAEAFRTEFADILHAFPTGEQGEGPSEAQLRELFTEEQLGKLSDFRDNHIVPEQLFNGSAVGSASPRQRILISSHILTTGTHQARPPAEE